LFLTFIVFMAMILLSISMGPIALLFGVFGLIICWLFGLIDITYASIIGLIVIIAIIIYKAR